MNADGHAVHLRLNDVLNFFAAEVFADGCIEGAQFGQSIFILRAVALVAVRQFVFRRRIAGLHLVKRQHRQQMFEAGKFFAGRATDALRGRFRRDEVGEILFQLLQFGEKLVVFAVGDELPALDIIGMVVPVDFDGELRVAFLGFGGRHAEIVPCNRAEGKTFLTGHRCATLKPCAALWQNRLNWRTRKFSGRRRGPNPTRTCSGASCFSSY